jgi:hypothetical protein
MRIVWLSIVVPVIACDPARIARFEISPVGARSQADSALMTEALRIAHTVAQRYQMTPVRPDDECPSGRFFAQDSVRGRPVGLNFCVRPVETGVEFKVVELITASWGPKGDALRAALADTLRAHFGDIALKTK